MFCNNVSVLCLHVIVTDYVLSARGPVGGLITLSYIVGQCSLLVAYNVTSPCGGEPSENAQLTHEHQSGVKYC